MAEGAEQEMSTHMTEIIEVSQENSCLGIHSPRKFSSKLSMQIYKIEYLSI
jgi:hypothetical protein